MSKQNTKDNSGGKYSEFLANKYGVALERVSFGRTELTEGEREANEFQDTAIKAQVNLGGQKKEVFRGIAI